MKPKSKNKPGRPRLYTKEEVQKRGLGTAGRSQKQILNIIRGEKQDRVPKAYSPWKPLLPKFKGSVRVKKFFRKYITHTSGEWKGKRFKFLKWQIDLIDELFKLKKGGFRQYKEAYVEIAKKNGKTELAAGLGIYLLLEDNEGSPEVAIAASDRKQASICFDVAAQMIRQNQVLSASIKILNSQKKLYQKHSNATLEVLSRETASKHGYSLSGLIFDELHAQKTPDLFKVLTMGSGAARRQPLFLYLTTAGWDRTSICWEIHNKAEEIKNGIKEDSEFLPIIYSMPEKADWKDEKNWNYSNPALGEIVKIEEMRQEFKKALQIPTFENDFRRLRVNEWTQQQIRWLSIDRWDECKRKIDLDSLLKKPCYGGLDLSSTQDLTVVLLVFPGKESYQMLVFFFCPEENIEKRAHKDKIPYDVWVKKGLIITTPGNTIDYSFVRQKIKDCRKLYDLKEVAFDRWRSTELVQHLQDDGIVVVPVGQNYIDMNAPIMELEKLILGNKFIHDGNLVMRWMCNNVALKKNAGGLVMFDKQKASEKIDGMTALAMAISRAMRHPEMKGPAIIVLGPQNSDKEEPMTKNKREKRIEEIIEKIVGETKENPMVEEEKVIVIEKPKKIFCPREEMETETNIATNSCASCGRRRDI